MSITQYDITVRGRLGPTVIAAFDDLNARPSTASTVLRGDIPDQAALYSVLERLSALGLELLEVRCVEPASS